jgi:hypothetical protein
LHAYQQCIYGSMHACQPVAPALMRSERLPSGLQSAPLHTAGWCEVITRRFCVLQ